MAEGDLEGIWLYTFEKWSAEQADRYQDQIIAAIEALAAGDRIGRPVAVREGCLKYAVGSHFVFHRLSASSLDVIRVLHQRMDVSSHL